MLLILVIVLFPGCISPLSQKEVVEEDIMNGKTITFQSVDGFALVGTLWEVPNSNKPSVILVHQFNMDRHTFDLFAQKLFKGGFTVLSFDVRGFGESTQKDGKTILSTSLTENDFQKIQNDISSAKAFLEVKEVLVVGASIGANAALNYGVMDPTVQGLVLLSPGINYKGIDVQQAIAKNNAPLLIVASKEDAYSAQSVQTIFSNSPVGDKKLMLLENAGHGTDMLVRNGDLTQNVIDWLNDHI